MQLLLFLSVLFTRCRHSQVPESRLVCRNLNFRPRCQLQRTRGCDRTLRWRFVAGRWTADERVLGHELREKGSRWVRKICSSRNKYLVKHLKEMQDNMKPNYVLAISVIY